MQSIICESERHSRTLARKSRSTERKIKGYKAYIKGMEFENKVSVWLQNHDYTIKRVRSRSKQTGEVDLICTKTSVWGIDVNFFVECKDKATINERDIVKFADKVRTGREKKRIKKAMFVYRGEMDATARKAINIMDQGLREAITFKKWPSRR